MHVEKITDTDRFLDFRIQWNQLLSTRKTKPLPLTHEWMSAWWKSFGSNRKLHICCVYEDDRLLAIAPFFKGKTTYRGVPVTTLSLMANGHSPYCDVIFDSTLDSETTSKIMDLLVTINTENIMVFAKIPETSQTYSYLVSKPHVHGHRYGVKDSLVTPIIKINSNWDEYFKLRTRKFRKNINNKINKFHKEKDFIITRETIKSHSHSTLNEVVEISKHSWKTKINNDLGANTASREFLFGLVDTFAADNSIQVWIMRKAGIPVAYEFHLVFDNVVYPLRADYHDDFRKYSPGSVLEYTALKTLFEEQEVYEYNSCADNYWYLNNWANEVRKQFSIEVFENSVKALMLHSLEFRAIPLLRVVRDKIHQH
ncbi:hypothetical protein MNBD_GAMMA23-374 [hydrothermal vent metagenome]|uniref:BioF2-like acetyltransferase domain-containing protein n=1 Tax=hydrothermal vent metagenome TaxID=652676 RepID=A0A3B0ZMC6_9ZZZZ